MATVLGTIAGRVVLDIRQAVAGYAALRAQNARTVYAMRGTGDSMVAAGKTAAVAGGVMVYAFAKVVQAAAEYERKMDFFGAVTDTNAAKMQKLSDFTLQLSRDTIYSAGEIADGMIELGKAGVSAEQIMNGIGRAMANLGAAGDIPLMESGQIITSTIQQYDLAAKDAVRVTDLLAGAANASIADITDIGVSLKYVGGVANAAGLTFEDTTTAISLLAKAGIRGSTAGTSLRQMIVSLGGATQPAIEAMTRLGVITKDGTNLFFDQEGTLKPLARVYQILQDHTDGLTQKQKLMYMRTIFNNRALSAASILTREGAAGFREMNKAMSNTTAADVAAERMDNLSGDLEILRGNIETTMIEAGTPFQNVIRGWVQDLTKLVQVFSDLDPKTQELIIKMIGMSGAALVAMGAFSIIVGTIFRFIAALLKLYAGLRLIGTVLRVVGTNAKWASALLGRGLIAAIAPIAGIIAVAAASLIFWVTMWRWAYKNIEIFRKAVDTVYGPIIKIGKALGEFFVLLAKDPGGAWEKLKQGASDLYHTIINELQKLPGQVQALFARAGDAAGTFVTTVKNWFSQLPGRVMGIVSGFVQRVTSLMTFRNLGQVIGTVWGTIIKLFVGGGARIVQATLHAVQGVLGFFGRLAPRVAYLIGFMVGRVIGLMIRLNGRMLGLVANLVSRFIGFMARLPARVSAFVVSMVARSVSAMARFATQLPSLAQQAVSGILAFIQSLPGRVVGLIQGMVTRTSVIMHRLPGIAREVGAGIYSGIASTISGLPGLVSGVIGEMISAFTGAIGSAYSAAKSVAGGLWEGFKDGIGMHSPSHIERAVWQINDTLDVETKKMAKKTMSVQKISRQMAATQFVQGDVKVDSGSSGIASLASMHARNQNRSQTLLNNSGNGRDIDRIIAARASRRGGRREFVITNWNTGEGFFRDIARGEIDDNEMYNDDLNRMG